VKRNIVGSLSGEEKGESGGGREKKTSSGIRYVRETKKAFTQRRMFCPSEEVFSYIIAGRSAHGRLRVLKLEKEEKGKSK